MEVMYFALMKSISNEVTGSCNNLRLNLWQIWTISGHSQTNLDNIEKEKKMIGRSREVGSERRSQLLLKHCPSPSDYTIIRSTDGREGSLSL